MPALRNSASTAVSEPASAPVCEVAARLPAAELPELTTHMSQQLAAALHLPFDPGTAVALERAQLASIHYLRGLGSFHAAKYDLAIMEFAVSEELKIEFQHSVLPPLYKFR